MHVVAKLLPNTKPKPVTQTVVDELGRLQAKIRPLQFREKVLVEQIRAAAEADTKPDQSIVYSGRHYVAAVTAKANKRYIHSMEKILKFLGEADFLSLCGFTLEAAEKNLSPAQLSEVVLEDRNVGTRTVKTMPRAAAA
jgi:hypothetical protein